MLAAAILILVGLLPALYSSRRKVWVRADPHGSGSLLRMGGLAMQRKPQFEEAFARLVTAVATAAGGPAAPTDHPGDEHQPGDDGAPRAREDERVQTP